MEQANRRRFSVLLLLTIDFEADLPPVMPSENEPRPSPEVYRALVKKLPDLWWGYMIALGFWAAQLYFILTVLKHGFTLDSFPKVPPPGSELSVLPMALMLLASIVYYFFCIYRFHRVAGETPGWHHPISPGRAVGFHFIPFFSYYWMFRWPLEYGRYLRWCVPNPGVNWQLGLAYIGSQLLFLWDPGAGVLATTGLLGYIRWRTKLALEFKAASLAGRSSPEVFSA